MKHKLKYYGFSMLTAAAAMFVTLQAPAQQINGAPGAPSATVTIDGKQIPPPPLPFGGVIMRLCFRLKNNKARDFTVEAKHQ